MAQTAQNVKDNARPLPATASRDPSGRRATLLALGLTLLGLGLAIWLCISSDGVYQDDDASHYEFAADGWSDPVSLWHTWARPGFNLPMAVAAHWFGLLGCRLLSALETATTAYLAYCIARRILSGATEKDRVAGVSPASREGILPSLFAASVAPALVWLQPLTTTLAATTLTETPAALYLTLAVWLIMRGNRILGCLAASLVFITRYELLALAPILAAIVLYDAYKQAGRKPLVALKTPWLWGCAAAMLSCPLAYATLAAVIGLPGDASPLNMFAVGRSCIDEYGTGGWTHFVVRWLEAAGPGVLALWAAGAICQWRRATLPWLLCAGMIAQQTFLYHYGLFASGGYARFLVPIGGLTAAVAAVGLAELLRRRPAAGAKQSKARGFFAAAAIAACLCAAGLYEVRQVRPLRLADSAMHSLLCRTVGETRELGQGDQPAITCHVILPLVRENTQVILRPEPARVAWENSPSGTLFFWENKYAGRPADPAPAAALRASLQKNGRLILQAGNGDDAVEVYQRS